jgi:undecaprenyl-diphosphatase
MEYYKQKPNSNIKIVALSVLAGLFALNLWFVATGRSEPLDLDVMQFAYGVRDDFLNVIVAFITRAGDTITVAAICVALVALPTRVRFGIPAAGAAVVAGLFQYILKIVVERARPDFTMWLVPEDGFSFPSGHANASFVFYLFLMILLRRYFIIANIRSAATAVTVALPLLVAVIGGSRVYLGVHYPTDIIGGWLLGAILLIVIVTFYDHFYPSKVRISFEEPSWEYTRRRRSWRRPQVSNPSEELIDFPKNRSIWKRPGTTARRRLQEEEKQQRKGQRTSRREEE